MKQSVDSLLYTVLLCTDLLMPLQWYVSMRKRGRKALVTLKWFVCLINTVTDSTNIMISVPVW